MKAFARPAGWFVPLMIAVVALVRCTGATTPKPVHADLSETDVTLAVATIEAALEHANYGETHTWRNPETGNAGAVTPQHTYVSGAGSYCRDYQETLTVNERSATYDNTACRDADGMWRWVD
jgi:surface antigen